MVVHSEVDREPPREERRIGQDQHKCRREWKVNGACGVANHSHDSVSAFLILQIVYVLYGEQGHLTWWRAKKLMQ